MAHSFPHRLPALLAATAAASAVAAAPALATEGPTAPPPVTLPSGVAPITFSPLPSGPAARSRAPRMIRRARLVPRRVRQGRRPLLRLSLAAPGRVRIVMSRRASGHRVRVVSVPARGRTVVLRLPARTGGHALRPGRYRVRVVAFDAQGVRSRPVRLTLIVRARR